MALADEESRIEEADWTPAPPVEPPALGLEGALSLRIQALLEERGWSQQDLADRLDVTQSTISCLIRHTRRTETLVFYERIARIFGVSLSRLIFELESAVRLEDRARLDAADTAGRDETLFRVRYSLRGGHVHCRMFQRRPPSETWQKNGDLVFDQAAWAALEPLLLAAQVDVLPE